MVRPVSREWVLLLQRGRSVPNSCLHFVLKRQALISWPGSFCSLLVLLPPSSSYCRAALPSPNLPFPPPFHFSSRSIATRWNFNTISFGSRWQTHSLSLSLTHTHTHTHTLFSSRATSLRSCFFTASRRRTIYNLNPPRSESRKMFFVPLAGGTRAGG